MSDKYGEELRNLFHTYNWSLNTSIDKFCFFVETNSITPMIAVGSGGSLTAAYVATLLHQQAGMIAKPITPLEFRLGHLSSSPSFPNQAMRWGR